MCMGSGCGLLYNTGVTAKHLRCPCGYNYWDIFQERFVPYRDRKIDSAGRALCLQAEEEEIKASKTRPEFESSMRAQFITHCISCGIKRRVDEGETDAGFDEENFLRAMCELLEIAKGDFESRGRSGITHTARASIAVRTRPGVDPRTVPDAAEQSSHLPEPSPSTRMLPRATKSPVSEIYARDSAHEGMQKLATPLTLERPRTNSQGQYGASRLASAIPIQGAEAGSRDVDRAATRSRHANISRHEADPRRSPVRRDSLKHFRPRSDENDNDEENEDDGTGSSPQATRTRSDRGGEGARSLSMFIPANGISQEILEHHKKRGTFGTWTSMTKMHRNGEEGFLIGFTEGTRPLDLKQIRRIVDESSILEARKKETGRPPRPR